jgi:hypothetical protein
MRLSTPELLIGCLLTLAILSLGMVFFSGTTWLTKDSGGFFTFIIAIVGAIQAGLFLVQLRLIQDSLAPAERAAKAAQEAATAAKTQADALMAAEGAHLYVVIKSHNVDGIFQRAAWYDHSPSMHASKTEPPRVQYTLKNYGKTPALLQHVWHGMSIQKVPGEQRTFVARDVALEVVGVGEECREAAVTYDEPFSFGDSRDLVTEEVVLYFYGQADYTDTFGVSIRLDWEFIADHGTWQQTQHREQRPSR